MFNNTNSPDNLVTLDKTCELLGLDKIYHDEERALLKLFLVAGTSSVNYFEVGTALILLSDSTINQKSELLISLFDTNENFIIGEHELSILARCCVMVALKLAANQAKEFTSLDAAVVSEYGTFPTSQSIKAWITKVTRNSKYMHEEGISVNDFTHFLLNSSGILKFLNQYGLFL